jgi:signal transduction histidine kinase
MAPETAARTTSPLPPETPAHLASRARSATLIAAAGLSTFFAVVAATRHVFLFDLGRVAWLFTGLILLNLLLAASAPRWAPWRFAVYAYQSFQVIVLSVILHRLGGVMMGILFITYAFPVIHGEMLRSDSWVFVTANLCGACYAAMAMVESPSLTDVGIDVHQQAAFVAIAFLTLNFVALYANRYGHQMRNLADRLQEKVAERTAELTAVNLELAAKARALEDKQDELKSFVYTVTHDLKSPLSAILLIADLLQQREGAALPAESREDLERIVRLASGTEDMIRDLLGLFRITSQPEAPGWVELGVLVARALETLRPQIAAKGVRVEVGALPRVWGQPRKLGHVVDNLLGNAVKYVAAERGEITVSGGAENGSVRLAVRDNGIGIPPAYHRGIFEVFGRVPGQEQEVDGRAVGGTGIGLAIVRRIVEAHRGSVAVESAPGAGSCFTVRLPAAGGV